VSDTPSAPKRPNPAIWLIFDVLGILVFVMIGRNNHDEESGLGYTLQTAAPFLIAMVAGWAFSQAWKKPEAWRTGLITWGTTLVGGMLLRRLLFDKGTASAFVIVATVFLALAMFTWRYVLRSIHRRMNQV
jgi:cell division protein FtsW (lipid II flippase)